MFSSSIRQMLGVFASLAVLVGAQTTSIDYCQALADVIDICESSTSDFLSLSATDQASCYCGTALGTLAWGPATFDGLASDCASQAASTDMTIASDASLLAGFCTQFAGGVQSGSVTQTASGTAAGSSGSTLASASPKNSMTSGASSTLSNVQVTSVPATKSDVSIVTVAATATASTSASASASAASSHNVGHQNKPQGLGHLVHSLIMQVLLLVAYF